MGTPCVCAMKPRVEKTAKPATKLVEPLSKLSHTQSLHIHEHNHVRESSYWNLVSKMQATQHNTMTGPVIPVRPGWTLNGSPATIVFEFVEAPKGDEGSCWNTIREEDLRASIHPHLIGEKKHRRHQFYVIDFFNKSLLSLTWRSDSREKSG